MTGTKIIRNDVPGSSDIVWSAFLGWAVRVGTGVAIVVIAASAIGAWGLFRRADKAIDSMDRLTTKVDALVTTSEKNWDQSKIERERLRIDINSVKNRLTAIDKKIEP